MTAWCAAICTTADVVAGEHCDVTVLACDEDGCLTDVEALGPVELPERVCDPRRYDTVEQSAAAVLARHRWGVPRGFESAGSVLYAGAVPLPGNPLHGT